MILLHNDNIDIHNICMLFKILLSLHFKTQATYQIQDVIQGYVQNTHT
jgi:hypothetical protein